VWRDHAAGRRSARFPRGWASDVVSHAVVPRAGGLRGTRAGGNRRGLPACGDGHRHAHRQRKHQATACPKPATSRPRVDTVAYRLVPQMIPPRQAPPQPSPPSESIRRSRSSPTLDSPLLASSAFAERGHLTLFDTLLLSVSTTRGQLGAGGKLPDVESGNAGGVGCVVSAVQGSHDLL
jgi:hypothetical protein